MNCNVLLINTCVYMTTKIVIRQPVCAWFNMTSVLVTGASRGIGLELIKYFLNHKNAPKILIAACRNPDKAAELNQLQQKNQNLHVLQLDVTKIETFPDVAKKIEEIVGTDGLNLLLNNAGVTTHPEKIHFFQDVKPQDFYYTFTTNVVGPLFLTQTLLPLLQRAADVSKDKPLGISRAAILNVGSFLGSVSLNHGGHWGYRESKAALNQATRTLALELKNTGILVAVLHPGHVRTDMGGPEGALTLDQSVSGLIKVIYSLDETNHNQFITWEGNQLQW